MRKIKPETFLVGELAKDTESWSKTLHLFPRLHSTSSAKLGNHPQHRSHFWYQWQVQVHTHVCYFARRTHRTHWKLSRSQLGFITVKGYRWKSAKGRDAWDRVQGSSKCRASSRPLPGESQTMLTLNYDVWQCGEYCPPGKLIWAKYFLLGLGHIVMVDCPQWPQVTSPSGHWAGTMWPKAPTLHHIVRLSFMSQGPRWTKTLSSGRTFQGLRAFLPGAEGKDQTSFWARLNSLLHTLRSSLTMRIVITMMITIIVM